MSSTTGCCTSSGDLRAQPQQLLGVDYEAGQAAGCRGDFIHNMGIRSYIDPVPALALGSSESNVYELVSAFSTFANQGVHTDPIFVTRIEDRQGNLIASFIPQSQDAVSERTAYTMLTMLQDVVNSGTAGRLRWQFGLTDMEIRGKTELRAKNRATRGS